MWAIRLRSMDVPDTSFNTNLNALGPPALAGTLPNGFDGCLLKSRHSQRDNHGLHALECARLAKLRLVTATVIVDVGDSWRNAAGAGTNPLPLARNFTVTNSVLIGGGVNSTQGEGTRTTSKDFDATTEVFNNTLIPGRDSAVTCPGHGSAGPGGAVCYTESGGAHDGASPPVTLYLTPAAACAGMIPSPATAPGSWAP